MRRLFLFFATAAALAVGATFHHAYGAGTSSTAPTFIDICHLDGTSSPGVWDVTSSVTEAGSTATSHTVVKYYAGVKKSVPLRSVPSHLAHGDSVWHEPLHPVILQFLTTMETYQDYVLDLGYAIIKVDYENVNLVPGNADCYWYTSYTE